MNIWSTREYFLCLFLVHKRYSSLWEKEGWVQSIHAHAISEQLLHLQAHWMETVKLSHMPFYSVGVGLGSGQTNCIEGHFHFWAEMWPICSKRKERRVIVMSLGDSTVIIPVASLWTPKLGKLECMATWEHLRRQMTMESPDNFWGYNFASWKL